MTDGLANTVMVAEKRLIPFYYHRDPSPGSGNAFALGYAESGECSFRDTTFHLSEITELSWPAADSSPAPFYWLQTDAAHRLGFNAAFADGSVRPLAYTTAPRVMASLFGRDDGRPIPTEF